MNKKILLIILVIFSSKLFADISEKQLDKYLQVSRGGQVLAYYQRKIIKEFSKIVEPKYRNQARNKLKIMIKNENILEAFNKSFRDLDEPIYTKIMKFYKTEEGNKSITITANFSMLNKKEMEIIFQKCKKNHTKDCLKNIDLTLFNILPKSKKSLLKIIAKEFDTIQIKRVFSKQSLLAMNLIYKKEYQYSNEFIESYSTAYDPEYNETTSKISYLFFKDFSEEELEKIVDYALSDEGQQEYKLIKKGIRAYTNEFIKRILMLYYPSKCVLKENK